MRQDDRAAEMTRKQHLTQYVCRTRFARSGALSFIGHLDLMKVFERAIRRAELPILYTQGYNPRPMLVFALPLGVGIDTTGDWMDAAMAVPIPAEEFVEKVSAQLPDDLKILDCISIDEPERSLMSVVTYAEYTIEAPGITAPAMKLFARETVEIEKKNKKGKMVSTDIRPLMVKPFEDSTEDKVHVMVSAGSQSNLRPDVFLKAVCKYEGYPYELAADAIVTRTELYGGEYPELSGIERLV
ncbi:radical SAM-linked protein [Ruminococcaceae bacterium KH2T8]|nr:radical SAM-linked protein [Ruminococcaceae bacterium KH2T8]